jgi:FdhE protein
MARAPIRIIPQGEIAGGSKDPPAFRLPDPNALFADRAARFETLAAHGAHDAGFLRFMARLAGAQHHALTALSAPAAPDAAHLARCQQHGLPPLGTDGPLDAAWRGVLKAIVDEVRGDAAPSMRAVMDVLVARDGAALDQQAQRLLALDYPALDPATVPLLGAALQVHWLGRVTALGVEALHKLDVPTVCPACGSPPVAGVLRIDGPVPGSRYLHCVLCATEWYMTRGACCQCETRAKLAYYHIEGASEAVKGEACDECKGYVKLLNHEKDPQADPFADDLATLALDVLLDESGYERASPNYFFVPGQG